MASIKIQSSSSGGGSITLTAPTTSSNRTVTLPDADVTLSGGAITHLGTLTPSAGATSLSLSSVNLSSYKFLTVHVNHVRVNSDNVWFGLNGNGEGDALTRQDSGAGSTGYGISVRAIVDLSTSVMYTGNGGIMRDSGSDFLWVESSSTYAGGHAGINVSTSTTTLTIDVRSGYSFQVAQGNIRFYGVA